MRGERFSSIVGALLIDHEQFADDRGAYLELYRVSGEIPDGLPVFVQDSLSISHRGVLRGLHYQKQSPQGHWVHPLEGRVFDVGVDLRRSSPSFGQYASAYLDSANRQSVYWPAGVAHGFYVLSERAMLLYKVTAYYRAGDEGGLNWRDPELSIPWPLDLGPIIKARDDAYPFLTELRIDDFPVEERTLEIANEK